MAITAITIMASNVIVIAMLVIAIANSCQGQHHLRGAEGEVGAALSGAAPRGDHGG